MNLLEQTKYLLKTISLKPDKLKGQNFCIDEKVLAEMIKTAEVSKNDAVLEAGPGFGFLTTLLVKTVREVIAIELEPALATVLKNAAAIAAQVATRLKIIQKDVLNLTNEELPVGDYKIVANLPYGITSVFLKKFLTAMRQPVSMSLLLQKEVAERICAKAGQMSLLAISVQLYAEPKVVKIVPPQAFWPKPKVYSAILKIENIKTFPFAKQIEEKVFWQVVRSGFAGKRKTLANNLANSLHLTKPQVKDMLEESGIGLMARAQELAINDWLQLAIVLKNLVS